MPELPEVETVVQGLLAVIAGKLIKTVTINRPNLRWPFPKGMKERLEGNVVLNVNRRSKYILVELSHGRNNDNAFGDVWTSFNSSRKSSK